jgi:hypothetical protein
VPAFTVHRPADAIMLFLVDEQRRAANQVETSTFSQLTLKERVDIQEWVIACPQLLGEDLLIITAEFDQFDRTAERLDVLAVDRKGKLVVVELKRTAVGTKADLQALRYAAYCSTLAVDDIAELHAAHLKRRHHRDVDPEGAREVIVEFIEDPTFEEFDDKPRIILAAEEFPAEITATLLWLRSFDLDISAVRLRPYRIGTNLVVDSSVLIPLPEARDYIIRRERKDVQQAARARGKGEAYRPWFQALIDELREAHGFTNARIGQPQNWHSFASGFTGIGYSVAFTHQGLRAEVYIDHGDRAENKRVFDALHAERAEIERQYGAELSWERLDERRASRVGIYREVTIASPPEELAEAHAWSIVQLLRLKEVFAPRLERVISR